MKDERRCRATSKHTRSRCKRVAIDGGTVCHLHGGEAFADATRAAYDHLGGDAAFLRWAAEHPEIRACNGQLRRMRDVLSRASTIDSNR